MTATAVIAAGGSGTRLGGGVPKQFLEISGKPLLFHTLSAFERASSINRVVVVLPKADLGRLGNAERERLGFSKITAVVCGGDTRQASVACGLEAITWPASFVAIHDAARCLVTPDLIDRTVRACEGWDGAIAALPVRDTLKAVDGDRIVETRPREGLWAMQTPQVFRFPFIRDAYREAARHGVEATDDAALAEVTGGRVRVSMGSSRNFKITYDEDLTLAALLLKGGSG